MISGVRTAAWIGAAMALAGVAQAADWPCYRGPGKTGATDERIEIWPPKVLWRANVGQGFSGVVVSQGHVYTMGWAANQDTVYCFSETARGTNPPPVWTRSYGCGSVSYEGTRATPTVSSNELYTFSHEGRLNCYEAGAGNLLWSTNTTVGRPAQWNYASSPLVEGNLVIVNAGGHGYAFARNHPGPHNIVWGNTDNGTAGYASPFAFTRGAQRTVVVFGGVNASGIDPATGSVLWYFPWSQGMADPIIHNDKLWVSTGYGVGCAVVKLGGGQLAINEAGEWSSKALANKENCSVLYGGDVYGISEGGGLRCVDFETGVIHWTRTGFGTESALILAGDELVVMNGSDGGNNGDLVIVKASPASYQEEHRWDDILTGNTWIAPTLANGRLYLRSQNGTLIALDVHDPAPRVVAPAVAATNPVVGTGVTLSVLGGDDGGETNLTYTWSVQGSPPAPVTFEPNGTNAAKTAMATFSRIGSYPVQVVIRDADLLTATSTVAIVVNATLSSLTLSPAFTNVPVGGVQAFTALAYDQFGAAMTGTPVLAWSVDGGGTIDTAGVFTAGSVTGGPFTVTVSNGQAAATASVTIPADWNTNGVPDTWELAYGMDPQNPTNAAADDDHDGMNNGAEYVAGTDPTNKQSTTKVRIECADGRIVVSYPAVQAAGPGYDGKSRSYDLEATEDLVGGQWTPVPDATNIPGTDTTAGYTNAGAQQLRFFRTRIRLE